MNDKEDADAKNRQRNGGALPNAAVIHIVDLQFIIEVRIVLRRVAGDTRRGRHRRLRDRGLRIGVKLLFRRPLQVLRRSIANVILLRHMLRRRAVAVT